MIGQHETLLQATFDLVRERLGGAATDEALAEGAALPFRHAVAHAQRAIEAAGRPTP